MKYNIKIKKEKKSKYGIKADNGKIIKQNKPIIDTDPQLYNKHIQAYNDSATLSNESDKFTDAVINSKNYDNLLKMQSKQISKILPAVTRLRIKNDSLPQSSFSGRKDFPSEGLGINTIEYQRFKHPIQPYKLQDKKIEKENINPLELQDINTFPETIIIPQPQEKNIENPINDSTIVKNQYLGKQYINGKEDIPRTTYKNGGKMIKNKKKKALLGDQVAPIQEEDESLNFQIANPTKMNNWNPQGGVNTNDLLAGSIQAISGLLPNTPIRDNKKTLINSYNPFPNGTGSHATFDEGGSIHIKPENKGKFIAYKKRTGKTTEEALHSKDAHVRQMANFAKNAKKWHHAQDGMTIDQPVTDQEREAWENMQSNNYQNGFQGNDHNQQPGIDTMNQYGINPSRLPAIQQDFLNLSKSDSNRVRSGSQGFSNADNFFGTKTASQRYNKFAYEHYDKNGKLINSIPASTNPLTQDQFNNWSGSNMDIENAPIASDITPLSNTPKPLGLKSNGFPTREEAIANRKPQKANWHTNEDSDYTMANGGNIEGDELYVEKNKASIEGRNMFTGDTVKFNGPSHDKGGIDINYGNTPVEVEGGETGFIDRSGNMNVFGNLHIPGTNTKFKSAGEDIAKEEKKANKLGDRGTNLINENNPTNTYENIAFNTGQVLQDAHEQRQKVAADSKEYLATLQNKMLDLADYTGITPKNISKAFKGKAKFGMRIADDGDSIDPKILSDQERMMKENLPLVNEAMAQINPRTGKSYGLPNAGKFNDGIKGPRYDYVKNYIANKNINNNEFRFDQNQNLLDNPSGTGSYPWVNDFQHSISKIQPLGYNPSQISPDEAAGLEIQPIPTQDELKNNLNRESTFTQKNVPSINFSNTINTNNLNNRKKGFLRNRLGFSDIAPELSQIFDQPEPVPGQQLNPDLYTPYQVSFDERRNANRGDFNAIERTMSHNPAALGALSAQEYEANNQINADEFRTNQGIQNDIINKNNQLTNQANITNLQLNDQQFVRQQQAKENTKANRFGALESLSNKYAQKTRDNNTLQLYEDMYHFGYNPNDRRFDYIGQPLQLANIPVGLQQPDSKKIVEKNYKYDGNDNKTSETDRTYRNGGLVMGNKVPIKFSSNNKSYSTKKRSKNSK